MSSRKITFVTFALVLGIFAEPLIQVNSIFAQSYNSIHSQGQIQIPSWIRNDAKWWSEGELGDEDFVKGLQYLMQKGIMQIPSQQSQSTTYVQQIPAWIKNNAGWWAAGQISDDEFVKGIQWLASNGIINTNTSNPSQVQSQANGTGNNPKTYISKDRSFSMNYPAGWLVDDSPENNHYSTVTISEPNGDSFISIGLQKDILKLYSLPDYVHKTFDQVQNNSNSTYLGEGKTTVAGKDAYFLMYMVTESNSNSYIKQVFVNANGNDVYFIALVTNSKSTDLLDQFDNLLPTFWINQ